MLILHALTYKLLQQVLLVEQHVILAKLMKLGLTRHTDINTHKHLHTNMQTHPLDINLVIVNDVDDAHKPLMTSALCAETQTTVMIIIGHT